MSSLRNGRAWWGGRLQNKCLPSLYTNRYCSEIHVLLLHGTHLCFLPHKKPVFQVFCSTKSRMSGCWVRSQCAEQVWPSTTHLSHKVQSAQAPTLPGRGYFCISKFRVSWFLLKGPPNRYLPGCLLKELWQCPLRGKISFPRFALFQA